MTDRDMVVAAAEKVLGWTRIEHSQLRGGGFRNGDGELIPFTMFEPLTSDADAFLLVDMLLQRLPQQDIHIQHQQGTGWSVGTCFDREAGGWDGFIYDPDRRRAIVRAALRAVGVEA